MRSPKFSIFGILVAIVLIGNLVFTGCAKQTAEPPVPTEPPVAAQSETQTPVAPQGKVVLVDPVGSVPAEITDYLVSFTTENGLDLETISSPELPPQNKETKVVIFLAEPANLPDIVNASPDTQFIVVGSIEQTGLPNLSIISMKLEDLYFMCGYLTMLIAWDWRAAGLIANDTVMAAQKADAFENGARYVCGQCTPYFAPLVYFPLLAQESSQASQEAWGAQITTLGQNFVNSFFVDPSIAKPEVLDGLKNLEALIYNDVKLIGLEGTAQPERFTALLGVEILPELQQVLPQVMAGKGGLAVNARIRIASITDEKMVTPGKVDDFNRVAADLAAGIIIPLSIP